MKQRRHLELAGVLFGETHARNVFFGTHLRVYLVWLAAIVLSLLIGLVFEVTPAKIGVVSTAQALSTVPTKMHFQGRLTNASGSIVANGTYNMQFRFYSASSGGSLLWSEERLVNDSKGVTVTNGLFSIRLGEGDVIGAGTGATPLDPTNFASGAVYLEVTMATPTYATTNTPSASIVWESPMSPRNQMATSAYAFNSETLDGLDSASFAQLSSANSFTAANSVNVSNTSAFQVKNGSTNILNVDSSGSIVTVGASDTTGAVFVLDTKTSTGDPAGASATNGAMYYNSALARFRCYENGAWNNCTPSTRVNVSTATQSVSAGTDTYLTGSSVPLPAGGLQGPVASSQNGTLITWKVVLSKTAAGTAASTFTVRFGTAGTTADTARCTAFSTGTATADADWAVVTITAYATAGGASATLNCSGTLTHTLIATGFSDTAGVQAYSTQSSFDTTTAGTLAGLSFTAGTGSTITVQKIETTVVNL